MQPLKEALVSSDWRCDRHTRVANVLVIASVRRKRCDYRDPPPGGAYDELLARSGRLMKHKPVRLTRQHRRVACEEMVKALLDHSVEIAELSMGATHFHIVARFVGIGADIRSPGIRIPGLQSVEGLDDFEIHKQIARRLLGIAKKRSARELSDAGLVAPGGVWAVRSQVLPVHDRSHQVNLVGYLRRHAASGAVLYR